jgi:hypothetical protein
VSLVRKQLIIVMGIVPALIVVYLTVRYASTLFGFVALPALER